MAIRYDKKKQQKVIAKTQNLLHSSERQRSQLRLQRGLAELDNHRFQILHNSEFVDALIDYLQTEYQERSTDSIRNILDKIGESARSGDKDLRERAVFILSVIADKILKSNNYLEFLEVVSLHLVNWLQSETEYLSGFHFICLQLQTMIQNMLRLGLWYQTENLVIILSQIQKGVIRKPEIIRKIICQVHADLADEDFLRKLVDVVLDKKEDRRDIAQCLLMHFGSKAAAVMVQALIDCKDKEKRFNLIELIPATGKAVVPICEYCLKQDPPWYVIRNVVIIISRLGDQSLYEIVRPHLFHKDIRVQMQILSCINKLGGINMRDRLIEALAYINDELKQQVVIQLGSLGGREVGNAFCDLLDKRDQFAVHVREELLLTIFNKIKFEPSPRALKTVKDYVNQRKKQVDEGDKTLLAAQEALISLELKTSKDGEGETRPVEQTTDPKDTDLFVVPVATEEEFDLLLHEQMAAIINSKKSPISANPRPQKAQKTPAARPVAVKKVEDLLKTKEMAHHLEVWKKFYTLLNKDEIATFCSSLKHRSYQPGEMVVARGNLQHSLYLFDSGNVRLARNKSGEEAYFQEMGTGDLIGSEIFISGEPWNLSLYAGKNLTAHEYNLENLIDTHVDHPQLADKILGHCDSHDILPGMLKVLDASVNLSQEMTRLNKPHGVSEQVAILQKLRAGLSYLIPAKRTEKISRLLHSRLALTLLLSSGESRGVEATIIGVIRTVAKPSEAMVFVRFDTPLEDSLYLCHGIASAEAG
jgi:CRP-like cAMP-binding protein/HEAT repeat protein